MEASFSITGDGEWLVFKRGGPSKWYARTPTGELAFGEGQGLYEWKEGERITHTGGDRQISEKGKFHRWSGNFIDPFTRGIQCALEQYNQRTN